MNRDVLERMLLDQSANPTDLPLSLLQDITNNFSDDQEIGTGGFAVVYKGFLRNGTVAVKKLYKTLDIHEEKFNQEVQCLMKAKHQNVVRFLGYCADTQGKTLEHEGKFVMADLRNRLLCFEYVPNGSLDQYITDASCGLEWRERYRIIKGICEGLHYLHDKRIVHLDLKPANILVDGRMVPKIADFGLSRCFDENKSRTVTSKLIGSLGYLAPESYNYNRQITFKLDIYSLGVIIMEILTGEKGYLAIENVVESWKNRLEASDEWDTQLEQVRVCTEIGIECMNLDPAKRSVTRHIIDRLDKTGSADSSVETGMISLSLLQAENASNELQQGAPKLAGEPGFEKFTAKQLMVASAEVMGKGTYGTVYKAVVEKDGSLVAVRRLRLRITKDDEEFEAEAVLLGKIRHPNLLVLRAYYIDTKKRDKLLLFDFMPKGSLSIFLHARAPNTHTPVDWATRMTIAKGTARGLAYLHDDMSIVHGNLSSRKVLLDDHSSPKIADFGMSRLMTAATNSNVLAAAGALGYRAPELSELDKKASTKTDVYSLGVIVLELLTGKSPADTTNGMDLPQWVKEEEKNSEQVFDPELMRDAAAGGPQGDELMDTLKLALQCVDESPSVRPEAREVLRQLEEIRPEPEGGAGPSDEGHVAPLSNE